MQTKEDQINRRCHLKEDLVPHVRGLMYGHIAKAVGKDPEAPGVKSHARLASEYRNWLGGI